MRPFYLTEPTGTGPVIIAEGIQFSSGVVAIAAAEGTDPDAPKMMVYDSITALQRYIGGGASELVWCRVGVDDVPPKTE